MKAIFIIFLILFLGCESGRDNGSEKELSFADKDFHIINVENIQETDSLNAFFNKITYIPLETNNESLIHTITRLEIINDKIIIFDQPGNAVLVFDFLGKFLYKIGKIGTGENEYIQIKCIAIDKNELMIYIYDQAQLAIVKYDLEGNFKKKFYHNFHPIYFSVSNEKFYYYLKSPHKGKYNNIYIVENNKIQQEYLPFPVDERSWFLPKYPFYFYNELLCYVDIFKNRTYLFNNNIIQPKYLFNFGKYNFPQKYLASEKLFFDNKKSYAYLTNEIFETEKYIQFNYVHKEEVSKCLYDKDSSKIFKIKFSQNWYEKVPPAFFIKPSFANEDYFISVIESSMGCAMKTVSERIKDQTLRKIINGIEISDNPIIIMYHLK
jgi:hypothetical protein